jgi:TRAP-type C4-dicarboxylate transport system permease small subunit
MMNAIKIVALGLIAAGVLALIYGGFSYTSVSHEAKIGPLDMTINQQKVVNVPLWVGVASIVVGAGLLLVGSRKA